MRTTSSVSFGSVETFETMDTSKDRGYSKADIENQARDLAEALILYGYAERAALRIQREFRARQKQKQLLVQNQKSDTAEEESKEDLKLDKDSNDENDDKTGLYTTIFLALFAIVTVVPKLLQAIWRCIQMLLGGDDTGGADAIANATMPQGGGGGGAVGPTPTGGEAGAAGGAQAGAQGAMAAQAASSAASGAASGVASSAAAGK